MVVRKVCKSDKIKRAFKEAQKFEELPEHTLLKVNFLNLKNFSFPFKHTEIRWGSVHTLVSRILEQKDALKLLVYEFPKVPSFLDSEWAILESLLTVLTPFFDTITELQSRRECISSVIPTYLVYF